MGQRRFPRRLPPPTGVRTGGPGPLPCPGAREARTWGKLAPPWGSLDKPRPSSESLSLRPVDGKRGAGLRTPALSGSVGAPGLCLAPGSPQRPRWRPAPPPGAVPGRFRNVGSLRLLPASRRPRKLLPERCPGEKRHWGGWGRGPRRAFPLLPGGSPEGPAVLTPLKPLVLPPETRLRV